MSVGFLARGTWIPALVAHDRLELPSELDAPARARAATRASIAPLLSGRRRNDVLVLVTELVTNSYRHAAPSPIVVHLAAAERVIRVEVCDDGPGFEPVDRPPGPDGGFGMVLLRSLADRWGVVTGDDVWFELEIS